MLSKTDTANQATSNNITMSYADQLNATKKSYPFTEWRKNFFPDKDDPESEGLKQYTQENCDKAQAIFDELIENLISLGPNASEKDKVELFKRAVLSLNRLSEEIEDLIETVEREELCELIDKITIAAGMNPKDYAEGEGIADEWRDW